MKWTKEVDNFLINHYPNKKLDKQFFLLNINNSWQNIKQRASELKLKRNSDRIGFNENYFDNIDSEDKAYFLGLFFADGCVKNNSISIGLVEKDIYILKEFQKYLGLDMNFYKNKKRKESHQEFYYFSIKNLKICSDLKKYGVTSRKSLTLKFPDNLPDDLLHHFLRGLFDGDGCVSMTPNKYVKFSFVGTEDICLNFMKILVKECNLKTNSLVRASESNTFRFAYSGKSCQKIKDFLYKDSTLFLTRKKEKFYE
jgi:hypothetical protein